MVLVVKGPMKIRFATLVTSIAARGAVTVQRLPSADSPPKPELMRYSLPAAASIFSPGYVRIIMSGSADCKLKKTGNVTC